MKVSIGHVVRYDQKVISIIRILNKTYVNSNFITTLHSLYDSSFIMTPSRMRFQSFHRPSTNRSLCRFTTQYEGLVPKREFRTTFLGARDPSIRSTGRTEIRVEGVGMIR